jgi:hypothetical protein
MPETSTHSHLPRRPKVTMRRKLIWIEKPRFQGCGCSECAWAFERLRDEEFETHVCAEHPKPKQVNSAHDRYGPVR